MSQPIAGLPATYDPYASTLLLELEQRTATGPGTYSSVFYRFTNIPSVITYNGAAGWDRPAVGAAFAKAAFTQSAIVQDGAMGSATEVTFEDEDDVIKTLAITYDMLDWKARLWEVGLDANNVILWLKLKIAGRCDDVTWDVDAKNTASIAILHDSASVQQNGPKEDFHPTCRFLFKSPRCGYVGVATVCNRTLTNCTALANQTRFGGFFDAPTPGTRISFSVSEYTLPTRDQLLPPIT